MSSTEILYVSGKGSQYRYFNQLVENTSTPSALITPFPAWRFPKITDDIRAEGKERLKFHFDRKKQKYQTRNMPDWWWPFYEAVSLSMYQAAYDKAVIEIATHKPKALGLWNGHRLPESAYMRAAEEAGCKTFFFENGLLPNTTTLDPKGVNDLNILPRDADFYRQFHQQHSKLSCRSLHNSLEVRENHKKRKVDDINWSNEIPEDYVFVPFQVNFDSQVLINSPRVRSMHELYAIIEELTKVLPEQYFVIKEHPSDPRVYTDLHDKNPRILFVNENTEQLIRNAKCIITLNSSVGLESLLFEQPVITLGNACYANSGLARSLNDVASIAAGIDNVERIRPDSEVLQGFVKYLENEYLIPAAWKNPDKAHYRALDRKLSEYLQR